MNRRIESMRQLFIDAVNNSTIVERYIKLHLFDEVLSTEEWENKGCPFLWNLIEEFNCHDKLYYDKAYGYMAVYDTKENVVTILGIFGVYDNMVRVSALKYKKFMILDKDYYELDKYVWTPNDWGINGG